MSKKTRIHRPTSATPKNPIVPRIFHQSTFLENHVDRRTGAKKLLKGQPGATYRRGETAEGLEFPVNTPEDNSAALVKTGPRLSGELLPDPPAEVIVDMQSLDGEKDNG